MTTIRDFNAAIHTTDEWIDDLMRRLSWHDRERAYLAFLAVLHALRDALPRDEAVYVGAQMPALLRGLYYEGWHPGARGPAKSRSAFLERIHDGVHRDPGIDAMPAPFLLCSRRACPRRNSRMPRPQRQKRCTTFGPAENPPSR